MSEYEENDITLPIYPDVIEPGPVEPDIPYDPDEEIDLEDIPDYNEEPYGLLSPPISVTKVQTTLGTGINNVGGLCNNSHNMINMWAKFKPIRSSEIEFKYRYPNYHNYGWGGVAGIKIPGYTSLFDMLNNYATGKLVDWSYEPPRGGSSEPYRLADFAFYHSSAIVPITDAMGINSITNKPTVQITLSIATLKYQQTTRIAYNLLIKELTVNNGIANGWAGNLYFGVLLYNQGNILAYTQPSWFRTNNYGNVIKIEIPDVDASKAGTYTAIPFLSQDPFDYRTTELTQSKIQNGVVLTRFFPIPFLIQEVVLESAFNVSVKVTARRTPVADEQGSEIPVNPNHVVTLQIYVTNNTTSTISCNKVDYQALNASNENMTELVGSRYPGINIAAGATQLILVTTATVSYVTVYKINTMRVTVWFTNGESISTTARLLSLGEDEIEDGEDDGTISDGGEISLP